MRRPLKAALGLILAVGLLAAVEGALRLVVPREGLLFRWERPEPAVNFTEAGGIIPLGGMRELQQDGPYRWHFRLDPLGLRESTPVGPRTDDRLRILALGDSWMFGWSVDQPHAIPDRLEALLPPLLDGRPVEVVNAAVFGSGAFDMLRRWQSLSTTLDPDLVLIGRPHNTHRQWATAEERAYWYANAAAGPRSDLRLYLLLRRMVAGYTWPRYAPGGDPESAVQDIVALARDARRRGVAPIFLDFGPASSWEEVTPGARRDRFWEAMEAEGVPIAGHTLDQRACWGFEDLRHPSEAGALVLAMVAAPVIATGRSLPAPSSVPRCAEVDAVGPGKPGWEWRD